MTDETRLFARIWLSGFAIGAIVGFLASGLFW